MNSTEDLPSSTPPHQRRRLGLAILAVVLFSAWSWMLLSAPGNTLHSVDNVRDFRVASAIASGEAFPSVSQPFAASKQMPPLFFYAIALPLYFWQTELAVFVFTAIAVLMSTGFLALSIRRRFGSVAAIGYLALALPPHGAIVFQGVSNPALAFVCTNVLLAAYLWSANPRTLLLVVIVLAAWAAPQMHPSAFFIASFVFLASFATQTRRWFRPSPLLVVSLLAAFTIIWILCYGFIAPEAQGAAAPDEASFALRAALSAVTVSHWGAVWSTPWAHIKAIDDIPSLAASFSTVASWFILSLALAGLLILVRNKDRTIRGLAIAVSANAIAVTASLNVWGFWYLDASWPSIALCAGIAVDRGLRGLGATRYCFLLFFAPLAMALPALVFFTTQTRGEYSIRTHGLYFPTSGQGDVVHIPTASTLVSLRALVSERAGCDLTRVVGVDEAYLRDMTLRTLFLDRCKAHLPANRSQFGTPERLLVRRIRPELPTPASPLAQLTELGPYRVYLLPHTPVVVNGNLEGGVFTTRQGTRYGFFAVQGLPGAAIVEANVNPGAALYVGFRCNDLSAEMLRTMLDTTSKAELLAERRLPPFAYTEFRLVQTADQPGALRLTTRGELPCDATAWVM
jgi:hypothetical protein